MKQIITVTILAALFAATALGWQFYEKKWGPEAQRARVEHEEREVLLDRVRRQLKDPESAQFKVHVQKANYICGEFNAKNSLGGYVGYKFFVVDKYDVNFNPDAYDNARGAVFMCH